MTAADRRAITWVFQIARNRRIDVKRRSRECCLPAEDFFTIPDPGAGCDEHIDAMQRQEYVRNALRALPHEQLALVKLAFFEGLSHSAIAAAARHSAWHREVAAAARLRATAAFAGRQRPERGLLAVNALR